MPNNYRPNVAVLVTDGVGRVLLCRHADELNQKSQTVQGGIDPGETPKQAAIREIEEEIGLAAHEYEFIGSSDKLYKYDWPADIRERLAHTGYIGQEQQFFLIKVDPDTQFKIDGPHQEFSEVVWGLPAELVTQAWERKQPGLKGSLQEFGLLAD
jgi:putative (di)nucleoside polyphosphate hydrolase